MNRAKTYGAATAALVLAGLAVAAWVRTPDAGASAAALRTVAARPPADPMLAARTKGSPDAPITIYEMSDFQCPFCLTFFKDYWPAIQEEYVETGKVKFTFLNLPLISIHSHAAEAHEYAMCAAAQDQFWAMHDRLFETQETWSPMEDATPHFVMLAEQLDLDRAAFKQCIESGSVRSIVASDVRMAFQSGLSSTPTFIIEGGAVQGILPLDDWRTILDSIYAAKTGTD